MAECYSVATIHLRNPALRRSPDLETRYPTIVPWTVAVGLGTDGQGASVAEILRSQVEGQFAGEWLIKICNRSGKLKLRPYDELPARRVIRLCYGGGYVTTVRLNHAGISSTNRNDAALRAWKDLPVESVDLSLCLGGSSGQGSDEYILLDPRESLIEMAKLYAPRGFEIPGVLEVSIATESAMGLDQDDGVPSKWRTIEVWESEMDFGHAIRIASVTNDALDPTFIESESDHSSSTAPFAIPRPPAPSRKVCDRRLRPRIKATPVPNVTTSSQATHVSRGTQKDIGTSPRRRRRRKNASMQKGDEITSPERPTKRNKEKQQQSAAVETAADAVNVEAGKPDEENLETPPTPTRQEEPAPHLGQGWMIRVNRLINNDGTARSKKRYFVFGNKTFRSHTEVEEFKVALQKANGDEDRAFSMFKEGTMQKKAAHSKAKSSLDSEEGDEKANEDRKDEGEVAAEAKPCNHEPADKSTSIKRSDEASLTVAPPGFSYPKHVLRKFKDNTTEETKWSMYMEHKAKERLRYAARRKAKSAEAAKN